MSLLNVPTLSPPILPTITLSTRAHALHRTSCCWLLGRRVGRGRSLAGPTARRREETRRRLVCHGAALLLLHGESVSIIAGSRMPWLDVDYVVTYINQVTRAHSHQGSGRLLRTPTPVSPPPSAGWIWPRSTTSAPSSAISTGRHHATGAAAGMQWPPMTLTHCAPPLALRWVPCCPWIWHGTARSTAHAACRCA